MRRSPRSTSGKPVAVRDERRGVVTDDRGGGRTGGLGGQMPRLDDADVWLDSVRYWGDATFSIWLRVSKNRLGLADRALNLERRAQAAAFVAQHRSDQLGG